ncbi:MAG: TonB-dependent receptor, partial [Leptospiraceae bacterium]|nr:TonB-dependent receptor [Leptospiraceae bacterium]
MKILYLLLIVGALNAQTTPPENKPNPSVIEEPKTNSKQVSSEGIQIKGDRSFSGITHMKEIEGTSIMSGKKNEVLDLTKLNVNYTTNNNRQVYGKIPGVVVWENDGSGIQTAIGTRGLSPNRAWEFNVRQNGYDISSDAFGYPEAYYTPPLEGVERIEVVRGAGALQYGPQFGGMLNYIMKKADKNRPFAVETRQTGGSYNLFNSYNSVGGTVGKFSYFVSYHHRSADSWRKNSEYRTQTGFVNLSYQATEKLKLGIEYTRSQYVSRQAAGLQDGQFMYDPVMTSSREQVTGLPMEVNPRQSNRSRNWFSAPWNLPVFTADYDFSEKTKATLKIFGLQGERNSVGNLSSVTSPDVTRLTTGRTTGFEMEDAFSPRQIDRDFYRNYGGEARFITSYKFLGIEHSSSFGVRHFIGNTDRIRNSNGTRGSDFTLHETNRIGDFVVRNADLKFRTVNYAAFYEHLFKITEKWSIAPGVRYEVIGGDVSGHRGLDNRSRTATPISLDGRTTPFNIAIPQNIQNQVILGGIGTQYKVYKETNVYANYTQAFRPVLYQELYAPGTSVDFFDPNLKNQNGYNADFGYRGTVSNFLNFDLGVFELKYNNRVGVIPFNRRTDIYVPFQTITDGSTVTGPNYRTNAGDSLSRGVEAYLEYDPIAHFFEKSRWGNISGFVSYAQVKAKYVRTTIPIEISNPELASITGNSSGRILLPDNGSFKDLGIVGNRVENAPDRVTRLGVTYTLKGIFSVTIQNSQIASIYTDATNTEHPLQANITGNGTRLSSFTTNGQNGKLDGYKISDISFTWNINEIFSIRGGINN